MGELDHDPENGSFPFHIKPGDDMHPSLKLLLEGKDVPVIDRKPSPEGSYVREHFRLRHTAYLLWKRHKPRMGREKLKMYGWVHQATQEELRQIIREYSIKVGTE